MLGFGRDKRDLEREIRIEMEYLTKLHGDDASRIALEKAGRPNQRTMRRRVLAAAARRLADPTLKKASALTASPPSSADQDPPASGSELVSPPSAQPAPVRRDVMLPEVDATVRSGEVESVLESKVEQTLARLESWMNARRGNAGQASSGPTSA